MPRLRYPFLCFVFCVFTLLVAPIAAHAGEGEGKAPAGPVYLRLKPITFSVIGPDNKISRQIGIMLQLELAKGKTAQDAEQYRREIEDRCLVAMTQLWDQRSVDAPPVSGEMIKQRLTKAVSKIAGPDFFQGVYIQELSERARR